MLRYWLDKNWVQYTLLFTTLVFGIYYTGWVFDFGYQFEWSVLFTENETYKVHLGAEMLNGLVVTIKISLISSALALALGTALGLARLSAFKPLQISASAVVEFFRNTPLLVQLFFWYFAFPNMLPEAAREWMFEQNFEFWCAVCALGVYTGSFMAEVIRAGLQSIPKGLLEAAYSSGLNYFQVLTRIILPLAFRTIIPPLGSEFLNNMKNSSLAMVIGVAELTWQSQQVQSLTFRGFEATTAATVLYLSLSIIISFIMNGVNGKLRLDTMYGRSWAVMFIDTILLPFSLLRRFVSRPVSYALNARRAGKKGTSLAPRVSAWRPILLKAKSVMVLTCKGTYLALLAGLFYACAMGLMSFDWNVITDNFMSLLIWRFPDGSENEIFMGLGGLAASLLMATIAISVSFFIGLVVGLGRCAKNKIFRIPCLIYIEVIRGNPLIIVIFWIYFFLPVVFGAYFDVFWSATIALTVFTGAYLAEIVRAGVQNVPAGQVEAAYSTGLSYFQTMRKIVLPQALKQMIPAIVGQFIAIFKDTSLAFVIGVLELTFVAQGLDNRLMVHPFEIWTTVAMLYFVCCYAMSLYAARLERKLSPEKVNLVM
ncbi:amino acid ABC transporter permease [Oleidesulfovibrio sp.]|uniref:amino acid ABC transporter permease n=1 Tax=Oleidesulfovibrio sp. TaxID=2909707 RepID=UPI003A850885